MMVSVDGYFEGPDHDISWHNVDAEFNVFANEQLEESGALLFGRTTYELMASYWPTPGAAVTATGKLMNEMSKYVASHEPFKSSWGGTTVLSGDAIGEIKKLKEQPGKDIAMMGSNNLCISLMEAGLVDEFRIMVNPIALGKGSSLFVGLSETTKLKLIKSRSFKSGNVLQYYINAKRSDL